MHGVLYADTEKTCLEKLGEMELKRDGAEHHDNSFIRSGSAVGECVQSDAASALDTSDSELLCHKQKKSHALDPLFAVDDTVVNVLGKVLPATAIPGADPVSLSIPSPVGIPEGDAVSVLRAVRSFPLPPGQRNPPVTGPPSLDEEVLRRMEQLQIPVSLAQEDVDRVARLELLKQLTCRDT